MYETLERSGDAVRGYEVHGELTEAELNEILIDLEEAITEHDRVNVLVAVPEFPWPDLGALEEDLAFWRAHGDDIEKYAVVGDSRLVEWAVDLGDRLTDIEVRSYDEADINDAWAWLEGE